jgi:hypothetical protein
MTLRWAVLPLAAAAVLAVAACDVALSTTEDDKTERAAVTEVRISGGGGDVTVQPGTPGQAEIHRKIRYSGDEPSGRTYRIDGGILYLDTDCGRHCDVSYDVKVPEGVKVSGENDSGDVRLTGVSTVDISVNSGTASVTRATGPVRVLADSGDILLTDVAADVTAQADAGDVRATNVRAANADVRVDSGDISLSLASPANVRAEASSGDVTVRVPPGTGYRVDASADDGDKTLEIPNDANGTHQLSVHTSSGDISVTTRTAG